MSIHRPVKAKSVVPDASISFTQLGLSLSSNLTCKSYIHSTAKHASQQLGFLTRIHGFFSSSYLLIIFKSQICPSIESGEALLKPLSVFLTKSSPKPFASSTILTSPNLSNLFPIVVQLDISPSFTCTFKGITLRRSGMLLLFL